MARCCKPGGERILGLANTLDLVTDASNCCPNRRVHRSDAEWSNESAMSDCAKKRIVIRKDKIKFLKNDYAPDVAHVQCIQPS